MKKIFISLIIFFSLNPVFCLAQTSTENEVNQGLQSAFSTTLEDVGEKANYSRENIEIEDIIIRIIQSILLFLGILFVILLIYGGFVWMMAGGQEARVDQAKKTIKQAILGLVIVFGSYVISYFIVKALSFLI